MLVEVCCNSIESALNAQKAGADRIELCSELAVGGITPSYGFLKAVSEKISIPVRVLIRPRSGDFTFSENEFEIMKSNIKLCVEMGFEGVVSGVLYNDFSLDRKRTVELIVAAENLKFTFHRAFDWVLNPKDCMEELANLGVDTILSSGQQKSALDGIDLLSKLQQETAKVTVMPGSGIDSGNVHMFKERGFKAIHLSGVKMQQNLQVDPKVPMNSNYMLSDVAIPVTSFETIQAVVSCVK
jgi:copper homeostasis protein